ncbi:hypothetical protein sce6702 [Sorangium cellulosum So ce56]|uniref:CHAT domain-containing protein n=1 Tax=Sorangium cellulosum (strain So ce56) TaxID=448385 RepID=A9GSX9_SORC5|nr:CHAT domain-containing protein [Sorangium cellulosum]CAN96871.1 hypothetical protein sce6702 [Sorangium cellulosum So ce56]
MKPYVLQVFDSTKIRFFDDVSAPRPIPCQRPLPPESIDSFCREVDAEYKKRGSNLANLGSRLYRWLDGPTERWLERVVTGPAALHIDVDQRLRHLPWELLCRDGAFLCANPFHTFTPVRRIAPATALPLFASTPLPANRPLRVLFMASSPENVAHLLDFEREESLILQATQRRPVELLVEESGSLEGVEERVVEHGPGYFDVLHLTGHADVHDGVPRFLLEDETGQMLPASASALARTFSNAWPRLIFLSGCKSAQAVDVGALPSLCEALVGAGAPAVLGWALPVSDHAASIAAAELYEHLAAGKAIDESVAVARRKLIEDNLPDWHLLRLYASGVPLNALVTPERTPKRERIRVRSAEKEFLDAGAQVEVCPRGRFVGRRRVLQRCLRVLRSREGEQVHAEGLLLHGLGGTGKSSLAARLLDRMSSCRRRFVWVGAVDEIAFLRVVSDRLPEAIGLLNRAIPLKARIRQLLEGPLGQEPALLVFDDFEHNLDRMNVAAGLKPAALDVLTAVLAAIRESVSESRVIVTCRYAFALSGPARLHEEMLDSMRGAELGKKVTQLESLRSSAGGDPKVRRRAIELGAGNPRLLEWLDKVLATREKALPILAAMAGTVEEFREAIFLDELMKQQAPACRSMLALLSVVNLPVDRAAVEAVVAGEVVPHLDNAREVGLLEVMPDGATGELRFKVSAVVRPLLVEEISEEERREACGRAARWLYQAWWKANGSATEERILEVYRLAFASREQEIAIVAGTTLAAFWSERSRFREAAAIAQEMLQLGDDFRALSSLAGAEEVLGQRSQAKAHYQQALASVPDADEDFIAAHGRQYVLLLCNFGCLLQREGRLQEALELWNMALAVESKFGDAETRAAILHNMANGLACDGRRSEAFALWDEARALQERTGDELGHAATLQQLAGFKVGSNQKDEAYAYWERALMLYEKNGDIRGRSIVLASMSDAYGPSCGQRMCSQAIEDLSRMGAWPDLVIPLVNLGVIVPSMRVSCGAQAFWLCVHTEVALNEFVEAARFLFGALGADATISPHIAAATIFLTGVRGNSHPGIDQFQRCGAEMLAECASKRGVVIPDQLREYFSREELCEPSRFLPSLISRLEALVPEDGWLFDRTRVLDRYFSLLADSPLR